MLMTHRRDDAPFLHSLVGCLVDRTQDLWALNLFLRERYWGNSLLMETMASFFLCGCFPAPIYGQSPLHDSHHNPFKADFLLRRKIAEGNESFPHKAYSTIQAA